MLEGLETTSQKGICRRCLIVYRKEPASVLKSHFIRDRLQLAVTTSSAAARFVMDQGLLALVSASSTQLSVPGRQRPDKHNDVFRLLDSLLDQARCACTAHGVL